MADLTNEQFERIAAFVRDAATDVDTLTMAEILETDDDDLIDTALEELRDARIVVVRRMTSSNRPDAEARDGRLGGSWPI